MNNKEKQQYLSDMMIYQSTQFLDEMTKKEAFLSKMPKKLFRYRKLDKYSFDMLIRNYVYLSPSTSLDDPFDCAVSPGLINNIKDETIDMLNFIVKTIKKYSATNVSKKDIIEKIFPCFTNGELDEEKAYVAIHSWDGINKYDADIVFNVLKNITDFTNTLVNDQSVKNFAALALNEADKIGICSFTTKKDNKVMWSLYGNKYNGICFEYDVPKINKVRFSLYPVLYKRNDDNNLQHKILEFAIANIIRFMSDGKRNNGIGTLYELLCTKDTDWKYQDEWRLIGDSFCESKLMKLKAVYLGFDVSDYKIKRVIKASKMNGFDVYIMKKPQGKRTISYKKIQ